MDKPLISIIVPIYNVEPYLHRCINSIITQYYQNIEVLLIDDESFDQSGIISDEYAKLDSRVRVIHRNNGGLSAARNTGIEVCKGEYIGFVDGDDFIQPDMYEKLYCDITRYNTLMAFCQTNVIFNDKEERKKIETDSIALPKKIVMRRALTEYIWWSACTKLCHRSLFNGIRYPEGRTNEDLPVTIRLYDKCDYIAVNYNELYNYCKREGSITTSNLNTHKFDILDNSLDLANYLRKAHPDLVEAALGILHSHALGLLSSLIQLPENQFKKEYTKTLSIIKQQWPSLLHNHHLNSKQKFLLTLAYIHPSLLNYVFALRKSLPSHSSK